MKEAFEKIVDRLEEVKSEREAVAEFTLDVFPDGQVSGLERAIEIVNQVAEEYAKDTNVSTNIVGELKEFLKEKKEYCSEQAGIYRELSYKDAYCRNTKDTYMDRANTFGRVLSAIKVLEKEYGTDINVGSNNGWIPCSERLPKQGEQIIGTFDNGNGKIIVMQEQFFMKLLEKPYPLVAWQPLPAPYKPKGE